MPTPEIELPLNQVVLGDSLEVLKSFPSNSVDSVVTDPPAGIAFMNSEWDDPNSWQFPVSSHGFTDGGNRVPGPNIGTSSRNPCCRKCKKHKRGWKDVPGCQCADPDFDTQDNSLKVRDIFVGWFTDIMKETYRVLKPGGYALVWSIPRTSHWTGTALEQAGFEMRDGIFNVKDRSPEVEAFLDSLDPEQLELLLRAEPTDTWMLHVFGSGFPKSLNVARALDKVRGSDPEKDKQVAEYLKQQREALGYTRAVVDEAVFRGSTRYSFVEGRENERGQFCIYLPTPEEWPRLKEFLKLDDRFDTYIQETVPSREWRNHSDGGKAKLERLEEGDYPWKKGGGRYEGVRRVVSTISEEAKKWSGWGTSLKPAVEVWWLVRKPLTKKSVAEQVLNTGTGAINVDGCRISTNENLNGGAYSEGGRAAPMPGDSREGASLGMFQAGVKPEQGYQQPVGRWPANLTLQHSPECKRVGTKKVPSVGHFPSQLSDSKVFGQVKAGTQEERWMGQDGVETIDAYECVPGCPIAALDEQSGEKQGLVYSDVGGVSRFFNVFEPDLETPPFFYTGKVSTSERNKDLDGFEPKAMHSLEDQDSSTQSNRRCLKCGKVHFGQPHCECEEPEWEETRGSKVKNFHPTAKSIKLMRHLVRLVTPPDGIVLDPFSGSGSTLVAAIEENKTFIGIEKQVDYHAIAQARVTSTMQRVGEDRRQREVFDMLDELPED
jgi:DNA modification methylase